MLFCLPKISMANINIVITVDDEIITNYDLEKESNYLEILNPNLRELDDNQILKLAKNSLINEIIKKKEVEKYISSTDENLSLDRYMNELLKTLNIDSEENFQIFLKKNNSFSIDEVREKIKIELFWNELIYSKHSNKLKIDRVAIIKKVDSLNDGEIKEYLLSEIVFNLNKNVLIF